MTPVKVITTSMCEDEQPTLSMIAPYQTQLAKNFEASDDDTSLIAAMKKVFREDFENRYTGVHDLIYTASALDPRFKMLPFLSDHEVERIFLRLIDEAAALDKEAVNSPDEHPVQSDPMETDPPQRDPGPGPAPGEPDSIVSPQIKDEPKDDDPPRKKKKSGALKQLFGELFQVRATVRTSREKASEEVTRYKQRDPLDLDEDPLQWWKKQVDLPLLSSLAKRYLCIPGTSVASERVFSTAGDVVTAQRSVLSHEHIDQLVFLKKNLEKKKYLK
ncbi:E3 SUMO-protein ligase ZBED1-like [Cololabis saira]|uniref:E3 SUMO-protein ligase ZBED1-like n=1 Tax=Cololabis saira TaxID=129043 RepID=UPI002AD49B4D|nr:E3 SUMO-protein ligase ZBED1-like [Cololabis saira]